MLKTQKLDLVAKIFTAAKLLFYTKTEVDSTINTINSNLATTNTNVSNAQTTADNALTKATNNESAIANLANLGTFTGSFDTYAALSGSTTDGAGAALTAGDFAELSQDDGDKHAGLYRYTASGWSDTPFVDYTTANSTDEAVTQDEVNTAAGAS